MISDFWKGKVVLVTGHTGFKGSWLSLWLRELGAHVVGYANDPHVTPCLYNLLNLSNSIIDIRGEITDYDHLCQIINKYQPEIVIHLAAQSLLPLSYLDPMNTFKTNILGTATLFEAIRIVGERVKVVLNITSDKCYKDRDLNSQYCETDLLADNDPYSCSKACSEFITNSFRVSYFLSKGRTNQISLATARSGNVIGGGDWNHSRLIPNCINAINESKNGKTGKIKVFNPAARRSWTYVLDTLHAYLTLMEQMWYEPNKFSGAWNIGPKEGTETVLFVVNQIIKYWALPSKRLDIQILNKNRSYSSESYNLDINVDKIKNVIGWQSLFSIKDAIKATVDWYKTYYNALSVYGCLSGDGELRKLQNSMLTYSLKQLSHYGEIRIKDFSHE